MVQELATQRQNTRVIQHVISDVIRKNKVNDNLVKIELDMDQGSIKAFARFYDKKFEH